MRPYGTARQSKQQLEDFEQYLNNNRTLVSVDNTAIARMRGDYAVTTLFNGNFDTITNKFEGQIVGNKNKEIYIVAGGDGQGVDQYGVPLTLSNKVIVPENIWKVVLILDKPGQGISDVTKDTLAFALERRNP